MSELVRLGPLIVLGVAIIAFNVWHALPTAVVRNADRPISRMAPFHWSLANFSYEEPRAPVPFAERVPGSVFGRIAKLTLAHWLARGTTEADTLRAVRSMEECFLVQVVESRVYVVSPNEAQYSMSDTTRGRRYEAVRLIAELARTSPGLPDVEVALCPDDCVTTQDFSKLPHVLQRSRRTEEPAPVFTHVSCEMSTNMPFPFWNVRRIGPLEAWDSRMARAAQFRAAWPWSARAPKAVFRGSVRRCYSPYELEPDEQTWRVCGRTRLKHLAHTESLVSLLDVDVGDVPFIDAAVYPRARAPVISMREQERYKAVINVEGNCGWADRMQELAFMGIPVINQETMCKEWYVLGMRPWVHYIPTDYYFDNLGRVVRWALRHDSDAQQMVRNMNAFARRVLSRDGTLAFARTLLRKYAATLRYQVRRRPDAETAEAYLWRQGSVPVLARIVAHEVTYFLGKHIVIVVNLLALAVASVLVYFTVVKRVAVVRGASFDL